MVGETSAVGGPLLWGGSGGAAWCDLTRRPDPPASGALDEKTSEEPLTGPQLLWQAGALRAPWLVDTSLQSSTVTAWPSLCASVAPRGVSRSLPTSAETLFAHEGCLMPQVA